MEAADAADQIQEAVEEERSERRAVERFRTRAAVLIALLAMLLAIASLGGDNATKETINSNIQASDTYAFYQAKNVRQTSYQLAATELQAQIAMNGAALDDATRQSLQQSIQRYQDTAARYESEPDPDDPTNPLKGEGKQQLLARAQDWEHKRDHAIAQDPNFDYSTALLQIAIVLGSVAIVATSRPILAAAVAVGAIGFVLMLNGFFLIFDLPIG